MAAALRETLLLPLDDLLAVTHEFHPPRSLTFRSEPVSAPLRGFQPQGLPQEEGAQTPVKTFKAYEPGFVHVDLAEGKAFSRVMKNDFFILPKSCK